MEDDLGAAEDERTIELSSNAAIYPEMIIDASDPYTATLDLPVTPEKPLKIYFQASNTGVPPTLPTPPTSTEAEDGVNVPKVSVDAAAIDTHSISHLPPLRIQVTLPAAYPATEPPNVTLSATPSWIPAKTLERLREDCKRLWEEMGKDQVVYTYIDHLQQAAEHAFELNRGDEEHFKLSSDLKLALLDYDLKMKREQFEKETFDCGICLEPKKGVQCHRLLLCGHVFCIACLQDFYNNCISEGDVDSVKCLSPSCGKDDANAQGTRRKHDRTLNPSELLQIPLEQETVQRYVRLKRKKKLEADKNTVYCPRQWCQGAARSKKHPKPVDPFNDVESSESERERVSATTKKKKQKPEDIPMSERLCVCEDCNFAFCSVCKKGWHGELASCNPRRQAELNEEERASMEYMKRFSTPCPTCNAPSQKTHGCNHMICFKCKSHFCYLCSSYLMPDNPFRHFNDFKSGCYMRLWELEQGDGADAGIAFAGGGADPAPWDPGQFDSDTDSEGSVSDDDDDNDDDNDEDEDEIHDGIPNIREDFILIGDDEDSEEEEPAPDQRRPGRNMHIEIVNFAGNGANRRIELPERPREAPPRAPDPPQRRGHGAEANRVRRMRQEPNRRPAVGMFRGVPAAGPGVLIEQEPRNLPNAAPGQGNDAQLPAGMRAMGLERFLELAEQDMEDEWDSDELDEDMPMPVPAALRRGGQRRRGGR